MKARCRARVSASYCADGCSSASRQSRNNTQNYSRHSRFGSFVRQTRRNASFVIAASPCQSELKRTLRRAGPLPNTVHCRGFDAAIHRRICPRMVNDWFRMRRSMVSKWWTRRIRRIWRASAAINRKIYGEIEFRRIFREFSADLLQCETLPVYRPAASRGATAASTASRSKRQIDDRDRADVLPACAWHSGSGSCSCCCPGTKTPESDKMPQISASDAVSAATAADHRHGPVLQAPARGLRGRRPGRDRDRPARHQDGARKLYQIITDKKPDHTSSIGAADDAEAVVGRRARRRADGRRSWRSNGGCRGRRWRTSLKIRPRNRFHFRRFRSVRILYRPFKERDAGHDDDDRRNQGQFRAAGGVGRPLPLRHRTRPHARAVAGGRAFRREQGAMAASARSGCPGRSTATATANRG